MAVGPSLVPAQPGPGRARLRRNLYAGLYRTQKYAVGRRGDQRLEWEPHEHAAGRNLRLKVLAILGRHPGELLEHTHAADRRDDRRIGQGVAGVVRGRR